MIRRIARATILRVTGKFKEFVRLGKADWADERNLILMSWQHLASLAPEGSAPVIGHTGIRLGGFSSNLFLYIDGSPGAER